LSSREKDHIYIAKLIPRNASVLEVGHGYGYTGLRLRHSNPDIQRLVGVDIYQPYCSVLSKLAIYDDVVNCDAKDLFRYPDKSFTVGLAIQVIEHDDGDKILSELERVCSCRVIAVTPDGYHPEDGKTRDQNPNSKHQTGYDAKYFVERGYKTRYIPRSRSRLITLLKNILTPGRHRDIIAWKTCPYYGEDAVICNEDPGKCPRRNRK